MAVGIGDLAPDFTLSGIDRGERRELTIMFWCRNVDTTASLFLKNVGAGVRVDVDVDPWVVGAGIGYRF